MPEFELSFHAKDMLVERNIQEEWLWRSINTPDKKGMGEDDNMHYMKAIKEREGRILHIVVNPHLQPNRIITAFFDRRLRMKK